MLFSPKKIIYIVTFKYLRLSSKITLDILAILGSLNKITQYGFCSLTEYDSDVEMVHQQCEHTEDRAQAICGDASSQLRETHILEHYQQCVL